MRFFALHICDFSLEHPILQAHIEYILTDICPAISDLWNRELS